MAARLAGEIPGCIECLNGDTFGRQPITTIGNGRRVDVEMVGPQSRPA